MTAINSEVNLTLDDAVQEVLGLLTGLDLTYDPQLDRYRVITRQLNRALRANALEHEWSYYSATVSIGSAVEGVSAMVLPEDNRPRVINDDAVRLVDEYDQIRQWAYFIPRDALHKYGGRQGGLWAAYVRGTVLFSRAFYAYEEGWDVQLPVMREPTMFRLPATGEEVDEEIRLQPIDFPYPDVVILRAAFYYAQTDPVMQPRVQTIEAQYKDLMYQIIERDDRNTDSPYLNEFFVPVMNGITPSGYADHSHPHSDERRV